MDTARESIRRSLRKILDPKPPTPLTEVSTDSDSPNSNKGSTPSPRPVEGSQRAVILAIQYHIDQTGNSPTYREIAAYTNIAYGTVPETVYSLVAHGWLAIDNTQQTRKIDLIHRLEARTGAEPLFEENV